MTSYVFTTASNCTTCARNFTSPNLKRQIQLFHAIGLFEFVPIDIFGPLPRTVSRHLFVTIMTDRYLKLKRAMPTGQTKSSHVANVFFNSWVVLYGISAYVLMKNEAQLTSKLFAMLCTMLGVKELTTTASHRQTNGQVKRYNLTIVTQLRHFIAENQKYWDTYAQKITIAYNAEANKSTNTAFFSLVILQHTSESTKVYRPSELTPDGYVYTIPM